MARDAPGVSNDGPESADDRPDPAAVFDQLVLDHGTVLADVGCGTGRFTLSAAERIAPGAVYAIDADGLRLDEIEAMALERGLENVRTISGAPEEFGSLLPVRVDVVLAVGSYAEVEAPTAFAEQVYRSLRPDGRFVVIDRRDRTGRSSPAETRSSVAPADLTAVRELTLTGGWFGLVLKRRHDAASTPVS